MKTIKIFLSAYLVLACVLLQAQTTSNQTSPKLIEGNASAEGLSEERLARIDSMCIEAE